MSTAPEGPAIPTVRYFLVLLIPGSNHAAASQYLAAHVDFIDAMTAANVVLLGGAFEAALESADAAYLLHTASPAEAEAWASRDPFVANAVYKPRIVAWDLVGISRSAIDPVFTETATSS